MIAVCVVRRFKIGPAVIAEACRVLEFPALPDRGTVLDFADGTGAAGVSEVRLRASSPEWQPGLYPVSIEVRTAREDGERLGPALEAGWTKLEPPV
jgi:hypothetical protein